MKGTDTMSAAAFRKKAIKEKSVHKQVVDWLKLAHPGIVFRSDGGGIRLTIGQATQFSKLQSSRAFPDLNILEARGEYNGFLLEIKRDRDEVYCKDGSLRKLPHIQEQAEMLQKLRDKDYWADFGMGFDDCQKKINHYLR